MVRTKKSQTKPFKQKSGEVHNKAHNKVAFQNVALIAKGDNRQAEQNNSWMCGMGGICVMQCCACMW